MSLIAFKVIQASFTPLPVVKPEPRYPADPSAPVPNQVT